MDGKQACVLMVSPAAAPRGGHLRVASGHLDLQVPVLCGLCLCLGSDFP